MSRPSPQEQAEIDAASEPADCRKCKHATITVAEGGCVRCGYYNNTRVSAVLAASPDYPCSTFAPVAPASPPVSADREGPDDLDTMYQANGVLVLALGWAKRHAPMQVAMIETTMRKFCAVISSEEARRARPAVEDPRRAALLEAREAIIRAFEADEDVAAVDVIDALLASDRPPNPPAAEDPRDAEIAKLRALLSRCATVVTLAYRLMGWGHSIASERGLLKSERYFTAGEDVCEGLRDELAKAGVDVPHHLLTEALRAAGMEPTL